MYSNDPANINPLNSAYNEPANINPPNGAYSDPANIGLPDGAYANDPANSENLKLESRTTDIDLGSEEMNADPISDNGFKGRDIELYYKNLNAGEESDGGRQSKGLYYLMM